MFAAAPPRFMLMAALALSAACDKTPTPAATAPTSTSAPAARAPVVLAPTGPLRLWSPAFNEGDPIPRRYTCEGDDATPPLFWRGVPPRTRSLALVVDDPDAPDPAAPRMTWVHWVLLGIPIDAKGLTNDAEHSGLPVGTRLGRNSWKNTSYGGPCPPSGRHRYYHRLYALDTELTELIEPTKDELTAAMEGHILSSATLMGTYVKQDKPPSPPGAVSPTNAATATTPAAL